MATVPGESHPYSNDGEPAKRNAPPAAKHPEKQGHCQRQGAQPYPYPRACHRAIAGQLPVNPLARHRSKMKNQTCQLKRLANGHCTSAVHKRNQLSIVGNCSAPCPMSLTRLHDSALVATFAQHGPHVLQRDRATGAHPHPWFGFVSMAIDDFKRQHQLPILLRITQLVL